MYTNKNTPSYTRGRSLLSHDQLDQWGLGSLRLHLNIDFQMAPRVTSILQQLPLHLVGWYTTQINIRFYTDGNRVDGGPVVLPSADL